jgi:hypothetical protein
VVFWSRAPGLTELEDELVAFPSGAHDDLVDAAVYAADLGASLPTWAPLPDKLLYSFSRANRRGRGPAATEPPPWWRGRMG